MVRRVEDAVADDTEVVDARVQIRELPFRPVERSPTGDLANCVSSVHPAGSIEATERWSRARSVPGDLRITWWVKMNSDLVSACWQTTVPSGAAAANLGPRYCCSRRSSPRPGCPWSGPRRRSGQVRLIVPPVVHIDRVIDPRLAGQAASAMRVALFSPFFPPQVGGAERFTHVLADFLARDGHEVTVVTLVPLGSDEELRLPYPVIRNPSTVRWVQIARESDVVHVNAAVRLTLSACAGLRRPIQTHHCPHAICPADWAFGEGGDCTARSDRPGPCPNCPQRNLTGRIKMAGRRASVHLAKANVSVSQYLGKRLGLPRSVTIYNPVDPRAFLCDDLGPGEDGLVTFAGHLIDRKGLDVLIRSLALVPDARLEVIGGPPGLWPKWKEVADQHGVGGA